MTLSAAKGKNLRIASLLVLALAVTLSAQQAPQSPFAGLIAEYLHRDANGHSPTPDEIASMASLQPPPDAASLAEAMPLLLKALANPDIALHTFALSTLTGLQTHPAAAVPLTQTEAATPAKAAPTRDDGDTPAAYKPSLANILAPYLPQIASHLTSEESQQNRLLTATILGGFTPNPPASIYPPLLTFLKRDDAIGLVGQAVVTTLYQLGPIGEDVATALIRYLRRSDQTPETRSNLADLIASRPNQSQTLNKALLLYLDSDDNALRARVILSLPQLDLAPDVYADTKSRIEQLAANPGENLQVVTAAKSVAPCWTSVKMPTGCPAY